MIAQRKCRTISCRANASNEETPPVSCRQAFTPQSQRDAWACDSFRDKATEFRAGFKTHTDVVGRCSPVTHEEVAHDGREQVVHHHFHLTDPRYEQRRHQIVELEREVYLEQPRSDRGKKGGCTFDACSYDAV